MQDFSCLISIKKKSGFRVLNSNDVYIFDESFKPFYVRKNIKGVFNLPSGKYYTNNIVELQPNPKKYLTKKLPKRERNHIFKPLFVLFEENKNKCQINPNTGELFIDSVFWSGLTKPEKEFVLFHEQGHFMFATETYADLYALKEMIKIGYNPSQIANAINDTLHKEVNVKRREQLIYTYFKSK